jgi:hypothetical protein
MYSYAKILFSAFAQHSIDKDESSFIWAILEFLSSAAVVALIANVTVQC